MAKQRIALKAHHFDDCLAACEPDAQFADAFAKMRALFAQCALDHERHRRSDDVSALDIERELLRTYVLTTVWARMQVLAKGRLSEKCLANSPSDKTDNKRVLAQGASETAT